MDWCRRREGKRWVGVSAFAGQDLARQEAGGRRQETGLWQGGPHRPHATTHHKVSHLQLLLQAPTQIIGSNVARAGEIHTTIKNSVPVIKVASAILDQTFPVYYLSDPIAATAVVGHWVFYRSTYQGAFQKGTVDQ